jgi:hypothetical protein
VKKKAAKNPWGFNDLMVTAAFRYCLGRKTYIVGYCCDWLIEQWDNFGDQTRALIRNELEDAFWQDKKDREDNKDYYELGHDCDREDWERVRALWKK